MVKSSLEMARVPWINPIGGLGDMLIVSGVLKLVVEDDPAARFNLARRTNYLQMFQGHPAIARIGYPPKDARILSTCYWSLEDLGPGRQRPFQVLARHYGLATPVKEVLYFPGDIPDDALLHDFVPWRRKNVLIAPASDSPRKMMSSVAWGELAGRLSGAGVLVLQAGKAGDAYVKHCYSLIGLTSVGQLLSLMRRCDLVITSDNFVMHAAALLGVKAVVLWGPTRHEVYGYQEHVHVQAARMCDHAAGDGCLAPQKNVGGQQYGQPCPEGVRHCMDLIDVDEIMGSVAEYV
jgi:ADP-heptose:LPS heptosyltransferase